MDDPELAKEPAPPAKKRSNVRAIPEGYEIRGHRLRLYPTFEQVQQLRAMQEEMRRAWNLLVGWRWAHADACVAKAERDGIVGPEPLRPEAITDESRSEALEAEWKAYARALGARRFAAIRYASREVPGYGFLRVSTNAWEYGALREWTAGGASVCGAHQYQALIKNFARAKTPRPRRPGDVMPLQVMSGKCYERKPPAWSVQADAALPAVRQRRGRRANATIRFAGLVLRAIEPYRPGRAARNPDQGHRYPNAPVLEGVALRCETDGWYAAVRLVVPRRAAQEPTIPKTIGVAVGLDVLCATSTGRLFRNIRRAETTLEVAQAQRLEAAEVARRVAKAKETAQSESEPEVDEPGSYWRYPGGEEVFVSRSSARRQTQLSRRVRQMIESEIMPYLQQYALIVIAPEDTDRIREMAQGKQTRLTSKGRGGYVSAMGLLLSRIRALGTERVAEVQWPGVSRTCSECGAEDVKAWRWRESPVSTCRCGYSEHRRINAARNVRRRYLELLETPAPL